MPVNSNVGRRALIASYFLQRSVLAWQCSVCRMMFCVPVEQAERNPSTNPPPYVEREFRIHSCQVVLVSQQEKLVAAKACPLIFESPNRRI